MIVFDTLFIILIIYLFAYCAYRLFFYIKSGKIAQYFEIQEKIRNLQNETRKLCIIIYATYKDKNLDKLLDSLEKQSYDKENYQTHVVYKKDELDTSIPKETYKGAQFHNIQNPDYFEKDKAVDLVLQKLLEQDEFDAYVFLDANRIVGEKYLENINKSIKPSCALVGSIIPNTDNPQIAKRVKNSIVSAYLKFASRTNYIVRSMFGLPFKVDGGNFIATSDVIKKLGYVGLQDRDSELEYTLDLIANDIKPMFSPYIISGIDIKNFNFESASLRAKISLFSHYFPVLAMKDTTVKEFIAFLLKPNSLFVVLAYVFLVYVALCFPQHVIIPAVILLGIFLFADFIVAMYSAKMYMNEAFWLLLYPVCLSWQKLKILINALTMRSIISSKYEEENVNSATINAIVFNGKKDVHCKLDLVSEDGMRKVVFREGSRFIVTDSFLRMYDALEDITLKLNIKGMELKMCQNCQHFTLCPDGTLDCLNGKCQVSGNDILVWMGCQYFHMHPNKKEKN